MLLRDAVGSDARGESYSLFGLNKFCKKQIRVICYKRKSKIPNLIRSADNIIQLVVKIAEARFFDTDDIEIFSVEAMKSRVALFVYRHKFAAADKDFYKVLQEPYKRLFIKNRRRLDPEIFQYRLHRIILQSVSVI